ncbi:hypothetical protein HYZ98_03720, partial [Candidatus Peregrinibacteria bacterium]|nr:hypothetical protein [Candidatus Peregrinibacteria bacterium]
DLIVNGGNINFGATTTIGDNGDAITIDSNGTLTVSDILDVSDNNITNVGDIALDTISSDAGTTIGITLGTDAGDDLLVDTNVLVVEGDDNKVGILTVDPTTALEVVGTMSGIVVHGQDTVGSSGTLVWETNASGSYLFSGQYDGGGLTDCDTATTSKLLWDDTLNRFSCGTDANSGDFTTASSWFVNDTGDTMSGALNIVVTSGTVDTIALESPNLLSGARIHANHLLTVSGGLVSVGAQEGGDAVLRLFADDGDDAADRWVFESEATGNDLSVLNAAVEVLNLTTAGALQVDSNVTIGSAGAGVDYTLTFDGETTDGVLQWMEDEDNFYFQDDVGVKISNNDVGVAFEVLGTISGTVLNASYTMSSSGNLVVEQNVVIGSGAIAIDHNTRTGTGLIIDSEVELGAVLALDSATGASIARNGTGSNAPHILFGYLGTFDTNLYRSSGSTLRTDDKFNIVSLDSDNWPMLTLDTEETTAAQNLITLRSDVSSDNDMIWRVRADGSTFADNAYDGTGADYAEWFYSKDAQTITNGDLVCIDVRINEAVRKCTGPADGNLIGIISTKPGFIGNSFWGAEGLPVPGYVLVGLIGQVPAKVIVEEVSNSEGSGGTLLIPVRPGDALTSASKPGYARRALPGESTVGVALEGLENGEGILNVLISRRNSSVTVETVEEHVLETIKAMEIEDEVQLLVSEAVKAVDLTEKLQVVLKEYEEKFQIPNSKFQENIKSQIETFQIAFTTADLTVNNALMVGGTTELKNDTTIDGLLTVTGDTDITHNIQIGGTLLAQSDVEVEGALNTVSLYVQNNAVIDGKLTASVLDVGSGSTVRGDFAIEGNMMVNGEPFDQILAKLVEEKISDSWFNRAHHDTEATLSGAILEPDSTPLSLEDLLTEDAITFLGPVTFQELAIFNKSIEVKGDATVEGTLHSKDEFVVADKQAGFVQIKSGSAAVTLLFDPPWNATPVIVASPSIPTLYAVHSITATGFTIELASPSLTDIQFTWMVMGTLNPPPLLTPEVRPPQTNADMVQDKSDDFRASEPIAEPIEEPTPVVHPPQTNADMVQDKSDDFRASEPIDSTGALVPPVSTEPIEEPATLSGALTE